MKKLAIILLLSISTLAKAQWSITSGPSEPSVTSLAANNSVLVAGCSSASTNMGGHRTLDNGLNWQSIGLGLSSKFKSVTISPSTGTIYAGGTAGFYISNDSGATFTDSAVGLSSYTVRDIIVEGSDLYVSDQGIYVSTNGGINWSLISAVMSSNKIDKVGNTILVGTITAGVYLSIDGGTTWTNPTTGLVSNILDVKIAGSNFLAATAGGLYISSNNGVSWVHTSLTASTQCIYQVGNTLFAGTDGSGVFYSNDGGYTWIASNAGLTNLGVYSLASNSSYIFAGTGGYVFRRPLSDFGIYTSLNEQHNDGSVVLSPNPSNGKFVVSQPFSGEVNVEVYNQLGQLKVSLQTSNKSFEVDASNLGKGIYNVRIHSQNGSVKNTKILLL